MGAEQNKPQERNVLVLCRIFIGPNPSRIITLRGAKVRFNSAVKRLGILPYRSSVEELRAEEQHGGAVVTWERQVKGKEGVARNLLTSRHLKNQRSQNSQGPLDAGAVL